MEEIVFAKYNNIKIQPILKYIIDLQLRFELPADPKPKLIQQKYNWKPPCYPNIQKMKKNSSDMKYMRAPNHSKPMKK